MYTQTLKKSRFLMVLLLLMAIPARVQASEGGSPSKKKIEITSRNRLFQSARRPHELLIPANGHCLYTSIVLGYLLPVVSQPYDFNQRLRAIMNKKRLPITHQQLASHYHDLDYLHSDTAFQQVISGLLKQINIQPGTWGGPKEIQRMAERLNLDIQEYTPNPDHPKQLTKGDLIQPQTWINPPEATLHIVQDTPLKEELVNTDDDLDLQRGQRFSLQTTQHRHHYRLYYSGDLPQPPQEQQKNNDNKSEQKCTHQENPRQGSITPGIFPQPQRESSLTERLKNHYARQNQLPGLLGDKSQPLKRFYIHLAMLTEEAHQVKKEKFLEKQPNPKTNWNKILDYSLLHRVEKPIKLEELWKDQEDQPQAPCHVVVMGEAGTGKSTLAHYIAYQWAKGNLWPGRFAWVLQVPLRKIRNLKDKNSHDQIAAALGISNLQGSDLANLLQQKQPGLLILDGYDEVAIAVEKYNNPLAQWLQPCFQNSPHLSIILTTRPGTDCPYLQHPRNLRVLGFQRQGINRYVKAYFPPEVPQNNALTPSTSPEAKAFLQILQHTPTLKILSHTPLYLRLLCILSKQQGPSALGKCSTPQLYQQIIGRVLCYNLARHNSKGQPDNHDQPAIFRTYRLALAYLSELAFEGIKNGQAVLPVPLQKKLLKKIKRTYPNKRRKKSKYWARIVGTGLLQGYTSNPVPDKPIYFPNLTIQEWLAARYLVTALYDKHHTYHEAAKTIIHHHKYKPRYQAMFHFMAGRLYQHVIDQTDPQGKGLIAFWQLLEAQPRELTGIHHAMMYARCLEACKADTASHLPDRLQTCHEALIKQVGTWLQAFINHPVNLQDVGYYGEGFFLPLRRPIIAGLQGCSLLLHHPLIIHYINPSWFSLRLDGNEDTQTTKRWHVRLAKMETLICLPLSHHTATHLDGYLQQALRHKERYVRAVAATLVPGILKSLKPLDALAWVKKALTDKNKDIRGAAIGAVPSLLNKALQPQDFVTLVKPIQKAAASKDKNVRSAAIEVLPHLLNVLKPQDRLNFLETFKKALADERKNVQGAALRAVPILLQALNPQDRLDVLEPIEKALAKNKPSFRKTRIASILPSLLQNLQPQHALGWFQQALVNENFLVREAAVAALPKFLQALRNQEKRSLLLHLFNKTLANKRYVVRAAVLKALPVLLKALQPQDALHWLQQASINKHREVRLAAYEALTKVADKVWKKGLKQRLQVNPVVRRQPGIEPSLKITLGNSGYLLLQVTPLVYFSKNSQDNLPGYKFFIQALKKQANTRGWPLDAYTAKPLPLPDGLDLDFLQ